MVSARAIGTVLLLAGSSAAAPRWWSHQGPGDLSKHAQTLRSTDAPSASPQASLAVQDQVDENVQAAYTPPPGGVVSNGILYIVTTVYLQPGQSPPTGVASGPDPVISSAQAAPAAPLQSQQAPAAQVSSLSPSNSPAATVPQQVPAPVASSPAPGSNSGGLITADIVLAIAPNSESCSGAEYPEECATAAQAAPALNAVFSKYGIDNKGAQAAVIAWEMLESGQLKYKMNHFPEPGTPGKGTRCMMAPGFVQEYATEVVGADKVAAAGSPAAVLDLVNGDDIGSFGGGAWYIRTKCPGLIAQLSNGADAAWSSFISDCIETSETDERYGFWTAAKQALGV